ncbi:MAG: PAS domain-containing protein [Defluviitaleaceae bacterium]|nr:PAS domain-containing protein [Defluviitaleaceae bacterium]
MDFLAETLGSDTEIVLHDAHMPESSIVAIRNGHISGRSVGGPLTNMALHGLSDPEYTGTKYLTSYSGKTASGKPLKLSTYFIRDESGALQGYLCINTDQSQLLHIRAMLDELIGDVKSVPDKIPFYQGENNTEAMSGTVEDLAIDSIEATIQSYGVDPERLSSEEKIEIIKKLNNSSIFLLKGTIPTVARYLKVSEPTIYRYLNKIKQD